MMNFLKNIYQGGKRFVGGSVSVFTDATKTVSPVGPLSATGGEAGGMLGRFGRWTNRFLTGHDASGRRSIIGTTVRVGLVVGAIAVVGKLIGNWLDRLDTNRKTKAVKAETEALQLRSQTAQINAAAEYINATGEIPYQFENVLATGGNRERYAAQGARSPLQNALSTASGGVGEVTR